MSPPPPVSALVCIDIFSVFLSLIHNSSKIAKKYFKYLDDLVQQKSKKADKKANKKPYGFLS